MDKTEERKLFEAIIPTEWIGDAISSESPDFLCRDEHGPFLGVEVTEVFPSDSAARLEKIPNYCLDILSSRRYRHSDDLTQIPVEKITFKTDGIEHVVDAVVRKPLPIGDALDKLIECIEKKSLKLPLYNKNVEATDLIIADRGGLFKWFKFNHVTQIVSKM